MYTDSSSFHLPDPERQPEFYADVPAKRLLAFVVDTVLILLLTLGLVLFTAGLAIFVFLPLWWVLNFAYRYVTLARGSATWGMRLFAIEFRDARGQSLDQTTAFLHTLGFMLSCTFLPLQAISIVLMLTDPAKQGLTDKFLGTVAMNRRAGY
ncbi:RDD family protein [Rhodalgimonas zhirmunskyi]|uniref:RDD family protein n=1 Tax=Rhodalgimonas zhirmunskyi TaxID=2964767 RepID=A0AAJ1UAX6_9RHOB|nr:RDD family protein [Rhodoalgimonas zhirmunskyi]MDQ2093206.1 RDD family protein [Rhodoalgimonas zhirmunskyi]